MTMLPGSATPDAVIVPLAFVAVTNTGLAGETVSANTLVVTGDTLPAASVLTTEIAPDVCGVVDVAAYVPSAATATVLVVPSGKVTLMLEPGSPVPDTFSVPSASAVVLATGAAGAVVSANVPTVAGETLPALSVAVAPIGPDGCATAEVIAYTPEAGMTALPTVPSGNVTLMVEPGSPVPAIFNVPSGLVVAVSVGAAGAEASANALDAAGEALPAASVATA